MRSFFRQGLVCILLVIGSAYLFNFPASAYVSPGSPNGYVNDFAHVLSADQLTSLTALVHSYKERTTNQIAVVTIPTTGDESIEQYAVQLFQEWGIGQKQRNNGVLLLVAIQDHHLRIEVGYGLESLLTDTKSAQIIAHAKPLLKAEKYPEALQEMTQEIMTTIDTGEPSFFSADNVTDEKALDRWGQYLILGIVIFSLLLFLIPVAWLVIIGIRLNKQGKGWGGYSGSSNTFSDSSSSSSDSYSSSSSSSSSSDSFGGGSSGGGGASGSW